MNMVIRDETAADERAIFQLTKRAFAPMPFSAGDEQHLINALRNSGALAISMVAVQGDRVVGHIAFSPWDLLRSSQNFKDRKSGAP